jgi:hypothetical protein
MRRLLRVLCACAAIWLLLAPTASPTSAQAATAVRGPSVVEVPYLGTLDVQPAEGWQFADCAPLLAATPLVTACSPAAFTVAAPVFDPAAEPVRVSVPLVNGETRLTVDYVIRLAPPAEPDAPDTEVPLPVPAGSRVLVPLSDLGMECGLCTPGTASVEVEGVDPSSAGQAWVTGAHVVFAASAGASGEASVALRLVDDLGRHTKIALMTVHVSAPEDTPLHGLHVSRPMPAEPLVLSAGDLAFAMPRTPELGVVDCGPAITGAVSCTPDGDITYVPAAGATSDQFSVQLMAPDGRQALTSVTLTAPETAAAAGSLASAAGAGTAPLRVPLPVPAEGGEEDRGTTTSFTQLLDRVGAR